MRSRGDRSTANVDGYPFGTRGDRSEFASVGASMIGESVGNFQVIRRLGQGGMGEVLLAEHKDIKTKVAIKMLLPHISADKQHVQRFFNEAVAVSKIKHAGITRIFDVGYLANGTAYLVMEYLEGESLASRIGRAGRLPPEQAADIARQITSVLEATHREGIIHRDLKPDNIFLVPDAELASGERVKILDFGIAKLGTSGMTQTGGAMGTPTYMSPEQWKNATKVDGRADLYSLGCLVFEMATGRPPFLAESIGELCNLHLNEPPPTLRSIVADAPPPFEAFIARLLAKDVQQRPDIRETRAVFSQLALEFRGVTAETMLPDNASGSHAAVKRWDTPDFANASALPSSTASGRPAQPTTLGSSAAAMQVHPAPAPKRTKLVVGVGALVLAAGAAIAFVATRGSGSEQEAAPSAPPPPVAAAAPAVVAPPSAPPPAAVEQPDLQRLRIQTVPADATITIDDAPVENPFDGKFNKSARKHKIEVRAPGYKPDLRWLAFDTGHMLMITLEKEAEPETVAKPAKPSRPTKPATKPTKATATTTPAATATPPVAAPTAPAQPASTAPANQKPTYKGTKGTIITDYPPN